MAYVPPIATAFVKREESFRDTAYADEGGVLTIGWGHTGPDVHPGQKITAEEGEALLGRDLNHAAALLDMVTGLAELTDNQRAALISFIFNLGCGRSWTLWQLIRSHQLAGVPAQIMRFVHDNGVVVRGLINRRTAECALWNGTDPLCAKEAA